MKKLNFIAFLLAALFTLTFTSCKDDDEDSPAPSERMTMLTAEQWTGKALVIKDEAYTEALDKALLEETGRGLEYYFDVTSWKFKFNSNGTGESSMTMFGEEDSETGNWEFTNNEQKIKFKGEDGEEDIVTIKKLTSTELYLEFEVDYEDAELEELLGSTLEIHYER
ncbi:lipocalin family protein [Pontibacter silvestris]|uniref:Lipocalin family protein n=1 Tax=Pontibacter silvestris TaxID=2305183 RepID=A0ABW4WSV6_9BACT|nr:lipocalin family protein [Pontibacter silvestris]MCC9137689.1 lipocalin family protein [Pontibacter silvestris]